MDRRLRDWLTVTLAVGGALLLGGLPLAGAPGTPGERHGATIAIATGSVLVLVALVVALARRRISPLVGLGDAEDDRPPPRVTHAPGATLFLASFVALFLELVLIRYAGSQFRIFSFFKNVPLISAFLGLGLGCALGGGRARHVLLLLLWMLPVCAALAAGPFLLAKPISFMAATASSEHILGDAVVETPGALLTVAGRVGIGAFCVATLFAFASLFVPIGRLLGDAFERLPRLTAYTVNIVGSLAGTCALVALGWAWAPPWIWMLLGTLPLLWWVGDRRQVLTGMALVAAATAAVTPSIGQTIWSPYQKLVGRHVSWAATPGDDPVHGYLVDISDVFYQVALDLRPEAVARLGENPFPHYDQAFRTLPQPIGRVLVVGAGTGNDVAGALRAGATHVDAVDIDPAIVGLGRRYHPERPYDDPRVRVVIDDARAAFRDLQAGAYDVVVFGLLDSHTQLGISSVRLDNYVFTLESFAAARRLLRPGGSLVVTAATFREWFRERFVGMLAATCDTPVRADGTGLWVTYTCRVTGGGTPGARAAAGTTLPTDDWPFLYLPARGVPGAYALVVLMLAMGSVLVVRANGLSPARFTAYHGHVFFLGAAFLLMEVYAINRLALLFGTTWVVSAVAIILVLTLIVAANLTLALAGAVPYPLAYAGLLVSLLVSFWLDPATVLGRGTAISLAYGLVVLLPVYFAGLVFARSFTRADVAGPAIGANMLGAVLGGWTEYATMALGIRALALLALAFYLGSLLCLLRERSVTGTSLRAARPAGRGTAA